MPSPTNPHYDEEGVFYDSVFTYADDVPDIPPPTQKGKKYMAKLKQNLTRRNPESLVSLAEIVLPKVAPTPPATPPIAGVADEAAALQAATTATKTANDEYAAAQVVLETKLENRRAKADALRTAHAELGAALEVKSHGDPVQLAATGYELAGQGGHATTPPEKIVNLSVTAGDADGSVDGSCDPDPKAASYEWEATTGDPITGPWNPKITTTASTVNIPNLPSGTRVWVRVRGVGAKGAGPWSDPGTKIVP